MDIMKAAALAMAIVTGSDSVIRQADMPMRLCLTATQHGVINGLPNYAYEGRVWGNDPEPHVGYWVVAIEAGTNARWAQNGGNTGANGGPVRFGVSNGSQYPLSFAVLRLSTEGDYIDVRYAATRGRALEDRYASRELLVSDINACQFDLDPPYPERGTPRRQPSGGEAPSCTCP